MLDRHRPGLVVDRLDQAFDLALIVIAVAVVFSVFIIVIFDLEAERPGAVGCKMSFDLVIDHYIGRGDGATSVPVRCPEVSVCVHQKGPDPTALAGHGERVARDGDDATLGLDQVLVVSLEFESKGPDAVLGKVYLDPVAVLEVGEGQDSVTVTIGTLEEGVGIDKEAEWLPAPRSDRHLAALLFARAYREDGPLALVTV